MGCRGQFDISQYVAEDSTTDPSESAESDTDESPSTEAEAESGESDSESGESESAETETMEAETEAEAEETETSADCSAAQLELAGGCIGLRQMIDTDVVPTDLALADFSNDLRVDLLLAGAEFRFRLGNQSNLFDGAVALAGLSGNSIAVADLDEDGHTDFAAIGTTVELMLAQGNDFTPAGTISGAAVDGVFANIDGDNDADLILSGGTLRVLTVENGSWFADTELNYDGERVRTADFDDDGNPDIVLTRPATDQLAVFENFGDGSFGMPVQPFVAGIVDVEVGSLDGDEFLELLALGSGTLAVYSVSEDFLSVMEVSTHSVGDQPRRLALADVDGDHLLDAVTVNFGSDDLSILLGEGGTLVNEVRLPMPSRSDDPTLVEAADLDGDGRAELVVVAPGTNRVLVFGYEP